MFFIPRTVQNVLHGGEKVPESPKWDNYLPVEASIPDNTVSLESILCTEQLLRRPWRPPDYKKENRALVALASALMDPQSNILQTLADTILDVTRCDSSGLSLLTKMGKGSIGRPSLAIPAHHKMKMAFFRVSVDWVNPTGSLHTGAAVEK